MNLLSDSSNGNSKAQTKMPWWITAMRERGAKISLQFPGHAEGVYRLAGVECDPNGNLWIDCLAQDDDHRLSINISFVICAWESYPEGDEHGDILKLGGVS